MLIRQIEAGLNKVGLDELYQAIKARDKVKHDLIVPMRSMEPYIVQHEELGTRLGLRYPDYRDVELPVLDGIAYNNERVQLGGVLGSIANDDLSERYKIPRTYYRHMEGQAVDLLRDNVGYWMSRDEKNGFLRTYELDDGNYLRGIMSDRYRVADNLDTMTILLQELERQRINVDIHRCDLTERRMYVWLTFPEMGMDFNKLMRESGAHQIHRVDDGDDPWFGGLLFTNSETGLGAVNVKPRLIRAYCQNGYIMEEKNIRAMHLGVKRNEGFYMSNDTARLENDLLFSRIRDLVQQMTRADLFKDMLMRFRGAYINTLDHPIPAIQNVAKYGGVSEEHTVSLIKKFMLRGLPTQYGVAEAVTDYAHTGNTDPERMMELEAVGASIATMSATEFNRQFCTN